MIELQRQPKEKDMDKPLMEAGLKARREVLGDEYVVGEKQA